jgi:hypothetical protein
MKQPRIPGLDPTQPVRMEAEAGDIGLVKRQDGSIFLRLTIEPDDLHCVPPAAHRTGRPSDARGPPRDGAPAGPISPMTWREP